MVRVRPLRAVAVAVAVGLVPIVGSGAGAVPAPVSSFYDPTVVRDLAMTMEPLAGWTPPVDWDLGLQPRPDGADVWTPEELAAYQAELAAANPGYLDGLARAAAWDMVRTDTTNAIELPATLRVGSDPEMAVKVRRKSSRALPSEADPQKVGLKVSLPKTNPYGVTKLSLENGGDVSPLYEGLAWRLHQLATGDGFYPGGYDPGIASWVTVQMNGSNLGVFTSVEQRNKAFLSNRGLWTAGSTWMYKGDNLGFPVLDEGPAADPVTGVVPDSPMQATLCFEPFLPATTACPTPDDATLGALLPASIDLRSMLTGAAVDAFTANGDALISKGNNFFFVDRLGERRLYYPWDLDAVFTGSPDGGSTGSNIYALRSSIAKRKTVYTQSAYQQIILNHPDFRRMYNQIMLGLLDGPMSPTAINAFLDSVQAPLLAALAADPYAAAVIGTDPAGHLASLRTWIGQRAEVVRAQVAANVPAPRAPYPGSPDLTAPVTGVPTLAPATAVTSAAVTVTATITDDVQVAAAEVSVNGGDWQPMTAADGSFGSTSETATATVTAPPDAGSYPVCVRAGDGTNLSTTRCATLNVEAPRLATAFSAIGPPSVKANAGYTLTATLTAGTDPVAGAQVTFVVNKVTYTATTNGSGVATATAKAPTKTGSYSLTVSYPGNPQYLGAAGTATLSVTK